MWRSEPPSDQHDLYLLLRFFLFINHNLFFNVLPPCMIKYYGILSYKTSKAGFFSLNVVYFRETETFLQFSGVFLCRKIKALFNCFFLNFIFYCFWGGIFCVCPNSSFILIKRMFYKLIGTQITIYMQPFRFPSLRELHSFYHYRFRLRTFKHMIWLKTWNLIIHKFWTWSE